MQCLVSLSDGAAGFASHFYNIPAVQKPPADSTEPVRASCIRPTRPYFASRNRDNICSVTNCARDVERRLARASRGSLLSPHRESFRPYLRRRPRYAADARSRRRVALPTPRDAFLITLAKVAFPPRVVAALDEPQQDLSALRSLVFPEGLKLGLGMWRRWRRTTAHGTWPAQFGALTGAPALTCSLRSYYTRCCPAWSGHLGIGAVAGTPSECGGRQIEGQVERQQQWYQAAARPLLADVNSESVQSCHTEVF